MNPFSRTTSWIIWLSLFGAYLYMAVVVMGGASQVIAKVAQDASCAIPLDLHLFGMSVAESQKTLECFGAEGRKLYQGFEQSEDIFYPIVYGLFFAFTLFALQSFCFQRKHAFLLTSFIPLIIIVIDFCENHFIVKMINEFPALTVDSVAQMSLFNSIKWALLFLSLLLIVIFSVWSLAIILSGKRKVYNVGIN